jgi:hypothetical protein
MDLTRGLPRNDFKPVDFQILICEFQTCLHSFLNNHAQDYIFVSINPACCAHPSDRLKKRDSKWHREREAINSYHLRCLVRRQRGLKKKLKQKSKENDNVSFSIAISKSANTLFRSFACLNVAVGVARYYLEFSLSIFEGF